MFFRTETFKPDGQGGEPFDGGKNTTGVSKVIVRCGKFIDGIALCFRDGTTTSWAGGSGGTKHEFVIEEDDCITEITIWSAWGTDALQFHTQNGRASPKYGGPGGKLRKEIASDDGHELVGIYGRCDKYVDQVHFRWGTRKQVKTVDSPNQNNNNKQSDRSSATFYSSRSSTTTKTSTTSSSHSTTRTNLQYPLLAGCQVSLISSTASLSTRPPVKLPQECLNILQNLSEMPDPYDFALERSVLNKKQEHDHQAANIHVIDPAKADREKVEQSVLLKMKSVTNAENEVCIALLEENGYDLNTSIEAFFRSGSI